MRLRSDLTTVKTVAHDRFHIREALQSTAKGEESSRRMPFPSLKA